MGPPIFIGGNGSIQERYSKKISKLQWGRRFSSAEIIPPLHLLFHTIPRFNGAADFHRRKLIQLPVVYPIARRLQWGRRFSSAEMW